MLAWDRLMCVVLYCTHLSEFTYIVWRMLHYNAISYALSQLIGGVERCKKS